MNMYSVLIDKNNKDEHELNGLINEDAVFRKVKLGDCFTFNEKNEYTQQDREYPFYVSVDTNTINYHVAPKDRQIEAYMKEILKNIKSKIKLRNNWKISNKVTCGNTSRSDVHPTNGHIWIEAIVNHISFIIDFQTLSFDGDTLNCYLDKIQFVAYPRLETLNYFSLNGDLHLMYPTIGDGNYCIANNRVVYNTTLNRKSDPDIVVENFIGFIEQIIVKSDKIYSCKKESMPKVYTHNG